MSNNRFQKIIEELILIVLISMNLLEFAGLLPGEASFVKAIISVTGLGYVLYKTSLSDIFFGERNRQVDYILLLSYFLMVANKFIQFSKASFHEAELLQEFFLLLITPRNEVLITTVCFITGTLILLGLSIYAASKLQIKAPSIMHAIHGESIHNIFLKFFSVFMIFTSFFVIFFNPVFEWFALVIDAPLIVVVVFFYIFRIHDIGRSRDSEEVLFKIAESVDNFFEKFIELFHSRKTLFFAIGGLLIFHLIADAAAFMVPYAIGTHSIYQETLEEQHDSVKTLYLGDKATTSNNLHHLAMFFGYIFNVLAMLFLMLFPCFIWYAIYSVTIQNNFQIRPFSILLISLFYSLMIFQIFLPVFNVSNFRSTDTHTIDIYGVDIQSKSILSNNRDLGLYFLISFIVFIFVFLLSTIPRIKSILFGLMSLFGLSFFGLYIYNYYTSVALYYINTILFMVNHISLSFSGFHTAYILIINAIFLLVETVFYIGGYFSFITHMFKD
ncbi:hypothetical protein HN789_02835 [archaeon]|nr:hypothetical protein [archaeon]